MVNKNNSFLLWIPLTLLSLSFALHSPPLEAENDQSSTTEDFFKDKTKIPNPFSLRDPFKKMDDNIQGPTKETKKNFIKDGVFTNIQTIDQMPLSDITIVGVLVGKDRRALAKIKSGDTVILKEGMFLGKDHAEIKAILPGGIVLVEKIINVYGQEEYLETILPVTEVVPQ